MSSLFICCLDLSEYEAAALDEAKKLDVRTMKSTVIESGLTDVPTKDDKTSEGNPK